ncbi:MAG: hypothetical protein NUK65_13425 [Firmicutes bacterium]|nr:hypothetical protein [Bacillota bacterium]
MNKNLLPSIVSGLIIGYLIISNFGITLKTVLVVVGTTASLSASGLVYAGKRNMAIYVFAVSLALLGLSFLIPE